MCAEIEPKADKVDRVDQLTRGNDGGALIYRRRDKYEK
jgi:hypothetical protein